jgi:hypothetical protein
LSRQLWLWCLEDWLDHDCEINQRNSAIAGVNRVWCGDSFDQPLIVPNSILWLAANTKLLTLVWHSFWDVAVHISKDLR